MAVTNIFIKDRTKNKSERREKNPADQTCLY